MDRSSDNWKTHTASTYDKRGNLILEQYGKNKKLTTAGAYTYDETNRMVDGVNGNAEHSIYTYNGLGALMEQTWIIAKNGYGYHDVSADPEDAQPDTPEVPDPGETPDVPDTGINNEGNGNNNGNNGNGHSNGNNGKGNKKTSAATSDPVLSASLTVFGNNGNGNNGNNGNGNGNQDKPTGSDVKKTSTVVKQFVVDFSREDFKPLMEHEVNGLDYRYVNSDKARLSVVVQGIENGSASLLDDKGELHAYYHTDYLGSTDYLTSAVNSKVISWTSYSEWGEITHNAVLKCGQRELDLVKEYATHDFDAVLNMYYAKARFYDADNRHFAAFDPILDPSGYDLRNYVMEPMALGQYLYVRNNAVNWIDPLGKYLIVSFKDDNDKILGYTLVPETGKDIWYNVLASLPLGSWVQMIVQDNQGVVGGTGKAGITIDTIISDAQGLAEGSISYIAHMDLEVAKAISSTAAAAVEKATVFLFIAHVGYSGLKAWERVEQDKFIVDLIRGAGFGLEYKTIEEITALIKVAEYAMNSEFFAQPYFKYMYGCYSKSTGRLEQIGLLPTADEISRKAQELSAEEYKNYIKPYMDNYKFYTSQQTEFKYPNIPDNPTRYTREEQNRRYEYLEASLSQQYMIDYRNRQLRSIKNRMEAALEAAREGK